MYTLDELEAVTAEEAILKEPHSVGAVMKNEDFKNDVASINSSSDFDRLNDLNETAELRPDLLR